MSDKVIVVLDRAGAEAIATGASEAESLAAYSRAINTLITALDRDPDALIEQVARAISDANDLDGWGWDRDTINGKLAREQYRKLARAALAAITGEGKD